MAIRTAEGCSTSIVPPFPTRSPAACNIHAITLLSCFSQSEALQRQETRGWADQAVDRSHQTRMRVKTARIRYARALHLRCNSLA